MRIYLPYNGTMRRKAGVLIPLEIAVLDAALRLRKRGVTAIHGYALAEEIRDVSDQRLLTSHGTLYRALHRLERAGYITSAWEDAALAEEDGRPRRRLYRPTPPADPALARARREASAAKRRSLKPGWGTT